MADKVKPIVIDCSEVETPEKKVVERTPAQWEAYLKNQVRICIRAEAKPTHRWGANAIERLRSKAKEQGFELTNLPTRS